MNAPTTIAKPTVTVVDGEIVIRICPTEASSTAVMADRLIRVEADALKAEGLELEGVRAKIREGELPTAKIGRALYVRLSDLLALVKTRRCAPLSKVGPSNHEVDAEADYFAMVTATRQKGARR